LIISLIMMNTARTRKGIKSKLLNQTEESFMHAD
jgi:hypothetical protein